MIQSLKVAGDRPGSVPHTAMRRRSLGIGLGSHSFIGALRGVGGGG